MEETAEENGRQRASEILDAVTRMTAQGAMQPCARGAVSARYSAADFARLKVRVPAQPLWIAVDGHWSARQPGELPFVLGAMGPWFQQVTSTTGFMVPYTRLDTQYDRSSSATLDCLPSLKSKFCKTHELITSAANG